MVDDMNKMEWQVNAAGAGMRIDHYLSLTLKDYSRSQVQKWIAGGDALVQGQRIKNNYKLALGDSIELILPGQKDLQLEPEDIPLDIAYEDADVIVVNKPRGMVVHPSAGHSNGTLVHALLHHCKDLSGINGVIRPGIVHRIDKDTSGLIMAAKHDRAHAHLAAQLKRHTVTRKYMAIVHGVFPHQHGTVDAPIGRDEHDRKMYCVTTRNSKHAVTHFVVMEQFADHTLLELQLETGRTHQIRVHLKFIDHPIVGDPVYGKKKGLTMDGQALHAAVLGFDHPLSGQHLQFEAPLPDDMEEILNYLRQR